MLGITKQILLIKILPIVKEVLQKDAQNLPERFVAIIRNKISIAKPKANNRGK